MERDANWVPTCSRNPCKNSSNINVKTGSVKDHEHYQKQIRMINSFKLNAKSIICYGVAGYVCEMKIGIKNTSNIIQTSIPNSVKNKCDTYARKSNANRKS